MKIQPVFIKEPGKSTLANHHIQSNSTKPVIVKLYHTSFCLYKIHQERSSTHSTDLSHEAANSPQSPSIVLVNKKDGTIRFFVDYRQLHRITIFNAEPIPSQKEHFFFRHNKKGISKYHQPNMITGNCFSFHWAYFKSSDCCSVQ